MYQDRACADLLLDDCRQILLTIVSAVEGAHSLADRTSRAGGIRSRLANRFGWGLADQAMSSLSNAAMSFYVARELGPAQFGAFSIAYVTYGFALNASRGLATEPLLVRFSDAKPSVWRRAVSRSTGVSVVAGVALGVCALIAGFFLSGTVGVGFIALGLTLPGLMLQDSWRYAFFAVGRGGHSFLNDTIWTVAMLPGILFLRFTHHDTVFWFVLMWGLAATLAACVGPLQAGVLPRPFRAPEWIIEHRDLGPRFLAENTSSAGASQLRTYCIGGIAGLATVGYVQAASLLMGPFLVVFMGISIVTVPEAARIVRNSPRRLRQYCFLVGAALAAACALWGVALLIAVPRGLGELLLGRQLWRPAYELVIPYIISIMGSCFTDGANAGLHALGAAKRSLRSMVFASLMYLGLGIIGAYLDGAVGVVWGAAFATWFGAVVWWRQLHIAMHEAGHWSPARVHRGLSGWIRPGLPVSPVSVTAQQPGEYLVSPPSVESS
jgi:O-antigen/teichoic acid export membrane protein